MSEESETLSTKERNMLGSGESVSYAKRCTRAQYGSTKIDAALVVLTSERLIASKNKVFGTPKADISVPWSSVTGSPGGEPWSVDPAQIVVQFETDLGPVAIINDPLSIYEIETRGRSLFVTHRERRNRG